MILCFTFFIPLLLSVVCFLLPASWGNCCRPGICFFDEDRCPPRNGRNKNTIILYAFQRKNQSVLAKYSRVLYMNSQQAHVWSPTYPMTACLAVAVGMFCGVNHPAVIKVAAAYRRTTRWCPFPLMLRGGCQSVTAAIPTVCGDICIIYMPNGQLSLKVYFSDSCPFVA